MDFELLKLRISELEKRLEKLKKDYNTDLYQIGVIEGQILAFKSILLQQIPPKTVIDEF